MAMSQSPAQSLPIWVEALRLGIQVIQVATWPAVVVILALMYQAPVSEALKTKDAQIEMPFGKLVLKAVASATSAGAAAGKEATEKKETVSETTLQSIAVTALSAATQVPVARNERRILWVDDTPSNNANLVDAFESLGFKLTQVRSTDEARAALTKGQFDVIISDMRRGTNDLAGMELVNELREHGSKIPIVIYSGSSFQRLKGREAEIGVHRIVNTSADVYRTVINLLTPTSPIHRP